MANKESYVQKELMQRLETKYPGIYLRKIAQSMYSHGGIPDLIGSIDGQFFAVEVKTDSGKLSKLQELEIKAINDAGGIALTCYGVKDIDYIIQILGLYTKEASV